MTVVYPRSKRTSVRPGTAVKGGYDRLPSGGNLVRLNASVKALRWHGQSNSLCGFDNLLGLFRGFRLPRRRPVNTDIYVLLRLSSCTHVWDHNPGGTRIQHPRYPFMTECRYPNNHMGVAFRASDGGCVSRRTLKNDLTGFWATH